MPIQLTHCTLGYNKRPILHIPHLQLHSSRCLGIFGPNGSGKTTLLRAIAGLLIPQSGNIHRAKNLRTVYLPQSRTIDTTWPMTALDAAAIPCSSLSLFGRISYHKPAIRHQLRALDVIDLAHRPFAALSTGQQQRILLAGVLATNPQLLLLDEPTDGLDLNSRDRLVEVLQQAKKTGLSIVLITHDPEELNLLADETAHLHPAPEPNQPASVELQFSNKH